jgi:MFS family permease
MTPALTLDAPAAPVGTRQAWSLVLALTLCNVTAQIDRFAMTLLITPMQLELGLDDTQTGLVGGLVTGVFYALAGLPLARLADQFSRKRLIVFGLVGWSLMTMASGLAVGFWTLCLARMLLAVGDASLGPAANSLIANVFAPNRLSGPLSVFASAASFGNALASLLVAALLAAAPWAAGWLSFGGAPMSPWRIVMLGLGLMGVLPLLAMLMLREPPRRPQAGARPDFRAFLAYLKPRRRAFGVCYLGYALFVLPFVALQFWLPTAFERQHGLPTPTVGIWLGVGALVAGAPGTLFGGWLAGRLERGGRRDGKLLVLMLAALAALPATVASQIVPDARLGTAFVWLAMFCAAMALGPVTAAIQALVTDVFRAQAAALLYLLIFIVAFMGIPLAGALTDHLFGDPRRLGSALILLSLLFCSLAVVLVARGRRHYLAALEADRR